MKKWLLYVSMVLALAFVLGACGASEEDTESTEGTNADTETTEQAETEESGEQAEQTVAITISENEGENILTEKEVPFEEGALLLDVMKENFEIEEQEGFISSIDGVAPEEGEEKSWMYFVNDEMPSVGAAEYELQPGDEITFDLQAWK